jgi:hypothetical protein
MIPFDLIRQVMIEGLASHLEVKIIEMNGIGKVLPYPFLTYDFTDEGSPTGHMAVNVVNDRYIHSGTVTLAVSFQIYADDRLSSVTLTNRARDWFLTDGHRVLKDAANVVVVTVGASQNRDIQIGDEWERRNGFDVELRTINQIEQAREIIETANLKGVDRIG